MTAEKTDLQKLEALLHSATNERQRKMYQALLTKARASSVSSDSASTGQQTTQSLTKKNKPTASTHNKVRGKSSKEKAASINNSTKKSVASNTSAVKSPSIKEKTASTKKATAKKKKASKASNANSATQINQIKQHQEETKTGVTAKAKIQSQKKTHRDGDVDQANTVETHQNNKRSVSAPPASSSAEPAIFQAVGIIKGAPYLEDGELFLKINEQKYKIEKKVGASRRQINLLKSKLEQNGSREMLFRVYPNITHYSDHRAPHHLFRLIRSYAYEKQAQNHQEGFTIRGIWRRVPHCTTPVITIHRNIDRLETFKQLPRNTKKPYAKAQDLPVVWDAPVEPFVYHPERADSEQMPCYFVQVRATFKEGLYIVEEVLSNPTLDIPNYIRRFPKNRKPRPKSTKSISISESNEPSIS